ncbi:hypothetical protein NL676_037108 [Syzygium grande]|nr:hypothetical protein NL676_037108 [Syzygium grande]
MRWISSHLSLFWIWKSPSSGVQLRPGHGRRSTSPSPRFGRRRAQLASPLSRFRRPIHLRRTRALSQRRLRRLGYAGCIGPGRGWVSASPPGFAAEFLGFRLPAPRRIGISLWGRREGKRDTLLQVSSTSWCNGQTRQSKGWGLP